MKTAKAPPRPRGRPRAFDRDAALERAMQAFWRHGYEATSIADLTAAMGINPPSLYAAFGDKQHLFLEAVGRYRCRDALAAQLAAAPSAHAAVAGFLESAVTQSTRRDRPAGCMVVTSALSCSPDAARVQDELARLRADNEALIRERLVQAVSAGELGAEVDVKALARFYAALLSGLAILARDGASRRSLLDVVRTAMRAWPEPPPAAQQRRRPGG